MLLNITMKILNVVGARPNFMKIAPIVEEMKKTPGLNGVLVHTGQHYDHEMSQVFFDEGLNAVILGQPIEGAVIRAGVLDDVLELDLLIGNRGDAKF